MEYNVNQSNTCEKKEMKMTSNKFKRTMGLLACSAFVAFSPAQANCLSLGEINPSQLVPLCVAIIVGQATQLKQSTQLTNFVIFKWPHYFEPIICQLL
jgi:hypothetical protein